MLELGNSDSNLLFCTLLYFLGAEIWFSFQILILNEAKNVHIFRTIIAIQL